MSWLSKPSANRRNARRPERARQTRPRLEGLESRTLLTAGVTTVTLFNPPLPRPTAVLELFRHATAGPNGETQAPGSGPAVSVVTLNSFSFSLQSKLPLASTTGAEPGPSVAGALSAVATDPGPALQGGDHFDRAVLEFFDGHAGTRVTFTDLAVSSTQLRGQSGITTDDIQFQFGSVVEEYLPQGSAPFLAKGRTAPTAGAFTLNQTAADLSTERLTVNAFSFNVAATDPSSSSEGGAGGGKVVPGTLRFSPASVAQAGLVLQDLAAGARFSTVTLSSRPAGAGDQFAFSFVTPASVQVSDDNGIVSTNVDYSFLGFQQTTARAPAAAAAGPGFSLELTQPAPPKATPGPVVGSPLLVLDLASFSFDQPPSNDAGSSGAGAGKGTSFGLTVDVSDAVVTPQNLSGFTQAVIVQRDARGRIVAEWDLDGLHLTAESIAGQNGALTRELRFSFAAVQTPPAPAAAQPAKPAGPGLSLELTRPPLPGETGVTGARSVPVTLNLSSFGLDVDGPAPSTGSQSSGAGAGKGFVPVLTVDVASAAVTPQDLAGFTQAVLVQRDLRGRVVAEWDFNGVHLAAASVAGQNGAIDQSFQFNFAAVAQPKTPGSASSVAASMTLQLAPNGAAATRLNLASYSFTPPSAPPPDLSGSGAGAGKSRKGVLDVRLPGVLTAAQLQALEQGVPAAVLATVVGNVASGPFREFDGLRLDSVNVSGRGILLETDIVFDFDAVQEVAPQPSMPVPLAASVTGRLSANQLNAELYSLAVALLGTARTESR